MSQASATSVSWSDEMNCRFGPGLVVERRIATVLSNEQEREQIIALKAYEAFCRRGFEHGSDLDDWLNAERELAADDDDVLVARGEMGIDISIADRAPQERVVLSIAPSSLLVLWTGAGANPEPSGPILHLISLPAPAEPERAEITYLDGRVLLHLPYQDERDR